MKSSSKKCIYMLALLCLSAMAPVDKVMGPTFHGGGFLPSPCWTGLMIGLLLGMVGGLGQGGPARRGRGRARASRHLCGWLWWAVLQSCFTVAEGVGDGCMAGMGMGLGWLLVLLMAPKKRQKRASRAEEAEEAEEAEGAGEEPEEEKQKRRRRRSSGGSSQRQQCKALKWAKGGNIQCTLQAMPGKIFCGNHIRRQSYGTVEDMPQVEEPELQQKPKEEVFECEGHELVSVEDISKNQDIDMFLLPLPVVKIGMLSSFWSSYCGPPMKVLSERPSNFLQLFHHPLTMFLELPKEALPQAWKAEVCKELHLQGVEIPLPTSPNQYNGSCIAKRTIKCHAATVEAALEALGIGIVHVGQYGCKIPLPLFQNTFNMAEDMREGAAFDLGLQEKGSSCICLFGLEGGKALLDIGDMQFHAYIHRILPGMVSPNDPYHWGTLELRQEGRAASEVGKVVQAYSPLSHLIKACGQYEPQMPTTMRALRGRKAGLLTLVDAMVAHAGKATGFRVEVRVRHSMGATFQQGLNFGQTLAQQLLAAIGGRLKMRRIPGASYSDFVGKELAKAIDLKTFSGMRDSGPDPAIEGQQELFSQKSLRWVGLIANIGLFSGYFARHVKNGMSCQDNPDRHITCPQPSTEQSEAERVAEEADKKDQARACGLVYLSCLQALDDA